MLRPEEVPPEVARKVLDFLNQARTAEEIGAAVEIAGERDVGLRVARRILDRRRELGHFADLRQVDAVPQVGPERFTEIVLTLAARPGATIAPVAEPRADVRALWQAIEALRAALGARARVTLRALQDRPWLGQAINLVATVTEPGDATPRVDLPVTFTTTWGSLRAVSGNDVRQGPSVVARTGVDGAARVVLRPPTAGEAREQERDSLETALLRTLDPAAATPRDALAGLRELARQYRREGGGALRRALDDTLRGLGQTPGAADPTGDPLRAWSYRDVTVVALAHDDAEPDPGATVVQAAAALTLALKDWIGPWLATFREVSEAGSRLGDDLRNALRRGGEPGELLGRVHDRVREFVEDQPGLVGQQVGRAVAERSLRDFLDRGLEGLSREANVALFPALEVASRAIAAADPSVLGAVGQVRADLRRDVDAQVGRVRTEVLGTLTPRLDGLQSRLDAKADAQALDGLRGELDALRLTTTRLDQAARDLNTNVSSLQTTFVRIDRDVQVLKGVRDVP